MRRRDNGEPSGRATLILEFDERTIQLFSGIVETTSSITAVRERRGQRDVSIATPHGWKLRVGESVSVEGVCSTIARLSGRAFQVTYMPETLRRTTLCALGRGSRANLERSLRLSSLIGGHLVQGHVDGTARIRKVTPEGEAKIYEFEIARRLSRYIVEKGSIAMDGVSLTVVESQPGRFTVSLLAQTLERTTLGSKGAGDRVNVEVDLVAKYIEKLVRR